MNLNGIPGSLRTQLIASILLLALFVLGVALPNVVIFGSAAQYLPIHTLLEMVSILVSGMVFVAGWRLRDSPDSGYLPLLGGAFLAVALIDGMHTLSYVGMPDFFTPNSPEKAINFWLAGRLIAIGSLLALALLAGRRLQHHAMHIGAGSIAGLLVSLFVAWLVISYEDALPRTFVEGEGLTSFKITAEYLLVLISLIAAIAFARLALERRDATFGWLATAALAFALAELFFTLYSDVSDLMNLLGHAFKAFGCMAIYAAFFIRREHAPWWSLRARLRLLLPIMAGLFVIEYVIMLLLPYLVPEGAGSLLEASIDATAMAFIASAIIVLLADRFQARAVRAEYALDHTHDGYCVIDQQGAFIDVNRKFCQMFGYLQERVLNMDIQAFELPELAPEQRIDIPAIIRQGYSHWQTRMKGRDGHVVELDISATWLPEVKSIVLFLQDMTTMRMFEQQIETLSNYDRLTRLPNRQLLLEHIAAAMSNSARNRQYAALLSINLDDFKELNHAKGREIGDEFLIVCAKQLSNSIGRTDIVASLGGDEFVVLLENIGERANQALSASREVAEQLRRSITMPVRLGAQGEVPYRGSAAIGITLFIGHHETPEALLDQATIAMHQAKSSHRGAIRFFSGEMHRLISDRIELIEDLRDAIEREQLEPYYQPQTDGSGRILGMEVLLRWRHPGKGIISPALFIPLAEESGLIRPIGRWLIRQACRQLGVWQQQTGNDALCISINISAVQLANPNFIAEVKEDLENSGISPQGLVFELTESLLVDSLERAVQQMRALNEIGIRFSLDDFGTGYSMLSYLTKLPLDELKIDQSFVRNIDSDANHLAVVRTIINMGHALGLHVIAEGVESEAELEELAANDCHRFQGYLFSRPLPAGEITELLLRGKTDWPPEGAAPDSTFSPVI